MRQIVLDTETTGLHARSGDRVIEIGCIELINRRLSGNNFHRYLNPERDSEPGALAVHGLTTEFLRDKPKFAEIIDALHAYINGAEIIIHNAPFDLGFLDAEYKLLARPSFTATVRNVIDTLILAKEMYPGKRNSLDALCTRYSISNAHRILHGALLDAELLAEVYLMMTRGQNSFSMHEGLDTDADSSVIALLPFADIKVQLADSAELIQHEQILDGLDKNGSCLWRRLTQQA